MDKYILFNNYWWLLVKNKFDGSYEAGTQSGGYFILRKKREDCLCDIQCFNTELCKDDPYNCIFYDAYISRCFTIEDVAKLYPIAEVENRCDLNWDMDDLCDDKNSTGWLGLDGKFYGCKSTMHSLQAEFIHKATEKELESRGWLKIALNYEHEVVCLYFGDTAITPSQYSYLRENDLLDDNLKFLIRLRKNK